MGNFSSRIFSSVNLSNASFPHENDEMDKVLKDFDLSTPTAAVIGAGISGVHVAYELAQLGFRVTVFEQRRGVALGETQYALPFVGVGLIHPCIQTLNMSRELLRGTLSFSCPDIISSENAWNSFFSTAIHRWLWSRRWSRFSAEEVMRYTNNLSRLSVDVIEDVSSKHPSLLPYIVSRNISIGRLVNTEKSNMDKSEIVSVPTAHVKPLMIDPVGWTRELAKICGEKYGVEFRFGEKLLDSTTYLRFNAEMMSTLRFSQEVEKNGQTEFKNRSFDVVVLTAGAQTGSLTWDSSQLPIIGLSGSSLVMQTNTAHSSEGLGSLNEIISKSSVDMISLVPNSSLVVYKIPNEKSSNNTSNNKHNQENNNGIVLQGLLSFDTTTKTTQSENTGALSRIEKYLRVKCGLDVPLLQWYNRSQQEQGEQQQHHHHDFKQPQSNNNNNKSDNTERIQLTDPLRVKSYVRAFTPDGVPLIANNGASFNSFVCAGFGDHAVDLAPGSAKILSKLIELEGCIMLEQDEKEMKESGRIINSVMPQDKLTHTHQELQLLLNGYLANPSSNIQCEENMERFKQNPFSAARFGGVVKEEVHDVSHISFFTRFFNFETRMVRACEPLGHYINQKAIRFARQDNIPDWLRTIVYYYFNDLDDDEEIRRSGLKYAEGIRRIREEFENKTTKNNNNNSSSSSSSAVS